MKKTVIFLCVFSFFLSCKKSDDSGSGAPAPSLSEHYPQTWTLINDASADKYTYLEVNGNNMKRSEIVKTYSLVQLALDNLCSFYVTQTRTEFTHKICYVIQLDRQRKRWLFSGKSSNQQEIHLSTTVGSSEITDPGGDGYRFFVHDLAKINGVKTVALESVEFPGYYISSSSPGFNYSPTQAVLTKASSPEKATPWQCR